MQEKIILRLEEEKDYRAVEELTREAFWNLHSPGADEHLLIHNLRDTKEFIKSLDFVACLANCLENGQSVNNEKIVGNIVYVESKIISCRNESDGESHKSINKEHIILTFGPVSVLPEYQNKGIGSKLINHTIKLSKKMNYKAIIIYGDPEYYKRFGFRASMEFNITNKEGKFPAALLVLELYPKALEGIYGIFDEGKAYEINPDESAEFDKGFPKKEKFKTESQDKFLEIAGRFL